MGTVAVAVAVLLLSIGFLGTRQLGDDAAADITTTPMSTTVQDSQPAGARQEGDGVPPTADSSPVDPAAGPTDTVNPGALGAPPAAPVGANSPGGPAAPGAPVGASPGAPVPAGAANSPAVATPAAPTDADRKAAKDGIQEAFNKVYSNGTDVRPKLALVHNSGDLVGPMQEMANKFGSWADTITVQVRTATLNGTGDQASFTYTISFKVPAIPTWTSEPYTGEAVRVGGVWKLTRNTVCNDIKRVNISC